MRRAFIVVLSTMAAVAVAAGPSSAASMTTHTDPNDTRSRPDIRKVWTDRGKGVFVQIASWDHLGRRDGFNIKLDTKGSKDYDRVLEIGPIGPRQCLVSEWDSNDTLGAPIGYRSPHRPGGRKIWCRFPSGWLDIHKGVRFKVRTDIIGGDYDDSAPNHGRYVRL